jgi:hypothetical protein
MHLGRLLNDIDRDTLVELFGGAPLAAVEGAQANGVPQSSSAAGRSH